jgi:hypothetical protein
MFDSAHAERIDTLSDLNGVAADTMELRSFGPFIRIEGRTVR